MNQVDPEAEEPQSVLALLRQPRVPDDVGRICAELERLKFAGGARFGMAVDADTVDITFFGQRYRVTCEDRELRVSVVGDHSTGRGLAYMMKILAGHDGVVGERIDTLMFPVDHMCRQFPYEGSNEARGFVEEAVRTANEDLDDDGYRIERVMAVPFSMDRVPKSLGLRSLCYEVIGRGSTTAVEWTGDELLFMTTSGPPFDESLLEALSTV